MKAAVLVDLRRIEFQDKPKPLIQSGEALIKVEYCGICGSDVHGYQNGIVIPVGTVMGHELTGVVAEVGDGVHHVQPGDWVIVKPSAPCRSCYWCRKGQYSICPQRRKTTIGVNRENDGAFAEYVKVRYPGQMLFKLPSGLQAKEGALAEPFSIALHGVRLSKFKSGDCAMIIGAGMIGLGVLQILKLERISKIIMLEISEERSRVARALGADIVLNPISEGEGLKNRIYEITDGIGADLIYDCAGVPMAFQTSMDCVKSGGQILVIGVYEQKVPFSLWDLLHREIEVRGGFSSYDEFQEAIELLSKGNISTDLFISDVISAKDMVEKGFEALLASKALIKIIVKMDEW